MEADRPERARPRGRAPESTQEALVRARTHARRAAAEALAALEALVDAGSLAVTGAPGEAHQGLVTLTAGLHELAGWLQDDRSPALLESLSDALDAEIERWEHRGRSDPDARAVLRAYLGVREILWELGMRPSAPRPRARRPGRRAGRAKARAPRVERVPVEG